MPTRSPLILGTVVGLTALASCGNGEDQPVGLADTSTALADPTDPPTAIDADAATGVSDPGAEGDRFPDIVDVVATYDDASDTWTFAVTVSSPYDTPERYADGWRVLDANRTVYGTHTLTHDHAGEQPFTRRQTGVEIPDDVDEVIIEGRDLANGFGGATMTISLHTA